MGSGKPLHLHCHSPYNHQANLDLGEKEEKNLGEYDAGSLLWS